MDEEAKRLAEKKKVCSFFNSAKSCKHTEETCARSHVCRTCLDPGHGKKNCPLRPNVPVIRCDMCDVQVSNTEAARQVHDQGKRHKRNAEGPKAVMVECGVCGVQCDQSAWAAHVAGKKHNNRMRGGESMVCEVCDVRVTGPRNMEIHMLGKRHLRLAAGGVRRPRSSFSGNLPDSPLSSSPHSTDGRNFSLSSLAGIGSIGLGGLGLGCGVGVGGLAGASTSGGGGGMVQGRWQRSPKTTPTQPAVTPPHLHHHHSPLTYESYGSSYDYANISPLRPLPQPHMPQQVPLGPPPGLRPIPVPLSISATSRPVAYHQSAPGLSLMYPPAPVQRELAPAPVDRPRLHLSSSSFDRVGSHVHGHPTNSTYSSHSTLLNTQHTSTSSFLQQQQQPAAPQHYSCPVCPHKAISSRAALDAHLLSRGHVTRMQARTIPTSSNHSVSGLHHHPMPPPGLALPSGRMYGLQA